MNQSEAVTRAFKEALDDPSRETVIQLERCWEAYVDGVLEVMDESSLKILRAIKR